MQTDINGIKWRKLTVDPAHTHIDPFEDPVLNTYAKCLQADILCVWRRMVKHSEQRPTEVSYGKELWIFWYGDPPVVLEDLLPPDLKGKVLTFFHPLYSNHSPQSIYPYILPLAFTEMNLVQ